MIGRAEPSRWLALVAMIRIARVFALVRVDPRVGVGEPAREQRVILEGGDPALPKTAAETAGHGDSRLRPVLQAGEAETQVPVGEALRSPDLRQPGPRVDSEPLVVAARPEALN